MIEWFYDNYEWLFGGAGVAILLWILERVAGRKSGRTQSSSTFGNRVTIGLNKDACITGPVAGGDINIYHPTEPRIEELISILGVRAERIREQLMRNFQYAPVSSFNSRFLELHLRHINALRNHDLVLAHEILRTIHELSGDLESEEFWSRHNAETPEVLYSLRPDAFENGLIVTHYLDGGLRSMTRSAEKKVGWFERRSAISEIEDWYNRVLNRK